MAASTCVQGLHQLVRIELVEQQLGLPEVVEADRAGGLVAQFGERAQVVGDDRADLLARLPGGAGAVRFARGAQHLFELVVGGRVAVELGAKRAVRLLDRGLGVVMRSRMSTGACLD